MKRKSGSLSDIVYICDGNACEGGCQDDLCSHTTDIEHALNFIFGGRSRLGEPFYMESTGDPVANCQLTRKDRL